MSIRKKISNKKLSSNRNFGTFLKYIFLLFVLRKGKLIVPKENVKNPKRGLLF